MFDSNFVVKAEERGAGGICHRCLALFPHFFGECGQGNMTILGGSLEIVVFGAFQMTLPRALHADNNVQPWTNDGHGTSLTGTQVQCAAIRLGCTIIVTMVVITRVIKRCSCCINHKRRQLSWHWINTSTIVIIADIIPVVVSIMVVIVFPPLFWNI